MSNEEIKTQKAIAFMETWIDAAEQAGFPKTYIMRFGAQLARIRKEAHLSAKNLASLMRETGYPISAATIYSYELAERDAPIAYLRKFSDVLNLPIAERVNIQNSYAFNHIFIMVSDLIDSIASEPEKIAEVFLTYREQMEVCVKALDLIIETFREFSP